MKALVAYGSKRGGTEGLAEMVADGLRANGLDVDVADAAAVTSLNGYDAVVIGGALYAFRWPRSARRLIARNAPALHARPVFLFSSGPLDDTASTGDIPPTRQVRRLMKRVGALEHKTFGGRLESDAEGFAASAMAKDHAGDWRDPVAVRDWADHVARATRAAVAVS